MRTGSTAVSVTPTIFWVSALLLASLPCVADQALAGDQTAGAAAIRASADRGKTRLEIKGSTGQTYRVSVLRDATVAPSAVPSTVAVIGEVKGRALVVVDTYPSVPAGLSRCQAGEEQFVRVIALARKPARQTYRAKTLSCRDNIELASPGLTWEPATSTLRIAWLLGPTRPGSPETHVVRITADGQPHAAAPGGSLPSSPATLR